MHVLRSSGQPGYSGFVTEDPRHIVARKLAQRIEVRFAATACTVQTAEGVVHAMAGDAILTGAAGENWRVSSAHFAQKYQAVPPTRPGQTGLYESLRYRVLALNMNENFQLILSDGVSQLTGKPGDWLVDYGDGSLGIVAPAIFAITYEILD